VNKTKERLKPASARWHNAPNAYGPQSMVTSITPSAQGFAHRGVVDRYPWIVAATSQGYLGGPAWVLILLPKTPAE
jgi:hypothetical protein